MKAERVKGKGCRIDHNKKTSLFLLMGEEITHTLCLKIYCFMNERVVGLLYWFPDYIIYIPIPVNNNFFNIIPVT